MNKEILNFTFYNIEDFYESKFLDLLENGYKIIVNSKVKNYDKVSLRKETELIIRETGIVNFKIVNHGKFRKNQNSH